jgi:protein involved in polysaccharide export with SLBB domain
MKRIFLLLIIVLVTGISASAQQIPGLPNNLNSVRSADISDEQIVMITQQMKQSKVTSKEAYQLMLQRGMSVVEANLIVQRIDRVMLADGENDKKAKDKEDDLDKSDRRSNSRMPVIKNDTMTVKNPKKIFGLEIFNNGVLQFEPDLQIATPMNYIIGPGDEIIVNIFGYQEAKHSLRVTAEGDISIPYAGTIYVAGLTIEQATIKIKNKLASSGYSNIRTGLTKVNVSIGRIRSIKVTILGEVNKPGTYTLPSLATVFNALYLSGGPNEIGSMRNIQVVRNGKIIDQLDMYDFLVNGNQSGNILLRDQDVIRIPAYAARVSFEGEVKRTGLFEVKEGESLQQLLNYAGGFTDSAFTASVKAYKTTDTEKMIYDVASDKFASYFPSRSETFQIGKVINRYANRVIIQGAVYLPGEYELSSGLTLSQLIRKAQGLKEEAYPDRGFITRVRSDVSEEVISFNPTDIMKGSVKDIELKKDDEVTISSVLNFRDKQTILINGEVRKPGEFAYKDNMSLRDALLLSGGFTDAASPQRIEIARRVKGSGTDTSDMKIAEVINVQSIESLALAANETKLRPWDVIVVRKNPSYRTQVNVRVEGEVAYPGNYVLQTKTERVSDIIKRAGGLTKEAYANGVYLKRLNNNSVVSQLTSQRVSKIQEQLKDTTGKVQQDVLRPFDQMAINLGNVLNTPGGIDDIILEEGDVLTIPQRKSEVRITGEVLFPTQVVYEEGMDIEDYLNRAGGLTSQADKRKIYVLYQNGNAGRTTKYLVGKKYPVINPGAEIIIPKKPENNRQRLSTGEIIGITTAITAMAGVLLQLIRAN